MRTYHCPDCENNHEQLLMHATDEPDPCPYCGNAEAPYIQLPSRSKIGGSNIARATDSMYNELEASSIARSHMAAEQMMAAGVPQADAEKAAREIRVTNLHDNLRQGDVAAMAPNNIVTQTANELQKISGNAHPFYQAGVSGIIDQTKQGDDRTTGVTALKAIQGGKSKW